MSEIDDLYLILRAQTAPLTDGFLQAGTAGEELAAKLAASMTEITVNVDRMAENAKIAGASIETSMRADQIEIEKLALATQEASIKMEAAMAKAGAANDAFTASVDRAEAAVSKKAAKSFALGAAGVALIGVGAIKMAGDFESSTQKIVSSGGEIQSSLNDVRAGMLDMAGQVGYSAMQLSDAFYKASSAGFNYAHGGLQVVRATAEGAKTEQADLVLVTDAVTSAMIDYHQPADQAALVTSKLVAATSAGKLTFQQLAGSMSQILPVASAAHISLNDILGDLASMTVHGMSADQAAQNLTDVINHMQKPTDVQTKELALLGMTTNDLSNSLSSKGLSGTLEMISERIRNFMPPGANKVIMDLGNALRGLPPAVQELGGKLIDGTISMKAYTKAAQALDPISAKQALSFASLAGQTHRIGDAQLDGQTVMQTYGAALGKATGDATGLRTALMLTGENYKTTTDAIKTVSGATTEAGNHVKGWSEIQGTFNQKVSEAKSGLGALAIEVGQKLLPPVSVLVGYLATGVGWLAKHHDAANALAIVLPVLALGFTAAAIAQWDFNASMLADPMTWIILGIVAAIAIVVIVIYELVKHWSTVWNAIKSVGVAIWHWMVDVWHSISKETSEIWHSIVNAVQDAWNTVVGWFKTAYHFVVDPIVGAWHMIQNATMAVWNGILAFLKKWWPLLLVIFAPPIAIIMAIWNHFHTQITNTAKAVWNGIKSFLAMIWDGIKTAAGVVWGLIHDWIVKPIEDTWHAIVAVWNIVHKWLGEQWQKIMFVAQVAWEQVRKYIVDPIENAWHQITDAASKIWHSITDAFDKAWHAVENVGQKFWDIGKNIVMGIIHGIENAGGALFDKLKNLALDALNWAKKFLGIGSPSTVFADQVGRWIPHGIAVGITATAGVATGAVAALAKSLTGSAALNIPVGLTGGQVPALGGFAGAGAPPLTVAVTNGTSPVGVGSLGGGIGSRIVVENNLTVFLDGKQLQAAQIRQAQRTKLRNGHSQMV